MGFTGSYTDLYGGVHANAYAEVTQVNLDAYNKRGLIAVQIFADQSARADKSPLSVVEYAVSNSASGTDYDDYFDESVIAADTVSPFTKGQEYVLALPQFSAWSAV